MMRIRLVIKILTIVCLLYLGLHHMDMVSSSRAQDNIMRLKAPKSVRKLWNLWNGKYVIYIKRKEVIGEFKDLDGMMLMVAFIDSKDILDDATKFSKASGLNFMVAIQNNPTVYDKQFLEGTGSIGFMVPTVAQHYNFDKNNKLVRIEFE